MFIVILSKNVFEVGVESINSDKQILKLDMHAVHLLINTISMSVELSVKTLATKRYGNEATFNYFQKINIMQI